MKKLIALLGWLGMSAAALAQTLTYKEKRVIKESRMGFRLRLAAGGVAISIRKL